MYDILSAVRVLDLSQEPAGAYCGRLFAQYGASVLKIEPPAGDALRRLGPFPSDEVDAEKSGLFLYLNAGKRGATLDPAQAAGAEALLRLARDADVLIEDFGPGVMRSYGPGPEKLRAEAPHLVVTSISSFGQEGPYRDYQATDLIAWAASGAMTNIGFTGQEPLTIGSGLSYYATGALAAVASLGALYGEDSRQSIDVSLIDGMIQLYASAAINRLGGFSGRPAGRDPLSRPQRCQDGYVAINPLSPQHWPMFCAMAGMVDIVDDARFKTGVGRTENADALAELVQPWFRSHTKDEVFEMAAAYALPVGFVTTAPDIMALEQHRQREYLTDLPVPGGEPLRMPGMPVKIAGERSTQAGPAPRLGEHNIEVYASVGYTEAEMAAMKASGAI